MKYVLLSHYIHKQFLNLCLFIKMQITATKIKTVKIILPVLAVFFWSLLFYFEIFNNMNNNNNNNFISINTVHIALKVDVL